jgi:hypothetical protein
MAPATVSDIPIYAGDSVYLEYRFRTEPEPAGDPVDLSAWTFSAQWRKNRSDEEFVAFTVDQSDKANGVIILTMTSGQAQSLGSDGFMDLRGINGPIERTFLQGRTVWTQDVTRD